MGLAGYFSSRPEGDRARRGGADVDRGGGVLAVQFGQEALKLGELNLASPALDLIRDDDLIAVDPVQDARDVVQSPQDLAVAVELGLDLGGRSVHPVLGLGDLVLPPSASSPRPWASSPPSSLEPRKPFLGRLHPL